MLGRSPASGAMVGGWTPLQKQSTAQWKTGHVCRGRGPGRSVCLSRRAGFSDVGFSNERPFAIVKRGRLYVSIKTFF